MTKTIKGLTVELRRFARERDWDQFHSPKNIAAALSVEAGEVLEHFQWLTEQQSRGLPSRKRKEIALELADVLQAGHRSGRRRTDKDEIIFARRGGRAGPPSS